MRYILAKRKRRSSLELQNTNKTVSMESAKAQVEQQCHRQKIKDSLEIKNVKTNRIRKVVNRDEGNLVKRSKWTLLFAQLT